MDKRIKNETQTVSDRLRADRRSRRLGFLLIGTGVLGLLLALVFAGVSLFAPASKPVSPWDFSDVKPLDELKAVPSAHGWSALDSFYATHPVVEGEEEYYLDPALWREPKRKAVMADTLATAPAFNRRTGLWTGPADGMLSVDTSIRPLQEQLKRQGAMPLQAVLTDSLPGGDTAPVAASVPSAGGDAPETAALAEGASAPESASATNETNGAYSSDYHMDTSGGASGTEGTASLADAPTSEKPLHVEFWESPVHYKGYQLNGNNLILYGINDADSLRFENHTDGVWMYHKEAVYRLTTSSEMQRFELISGTSSLEEPAADAEDEAADAQ